MDELTRQAEAIGLAAGKPSAGVPLRVQPNSLYLVKVRAVADAPGGRVAKVRLQLGYQDGEQPWVLVRFVEFDLPVVSDADEDYAQRGRWYEQAVFLRTGEIANALRCSKVVKDASTLVLSAAPVSVDAASLDGIRRLLPELAGRSVRLNGATCKPFLGVSEAQEYIADWQKTLARAELPEPRPLPRPLQASFPRVGVIGDDMLAGILATGYSTVRISPANVGLVDSDALDVVVLQQRAAAIAPRDSSKDVEEQFAADLTGALLRTGTPVVQIAPDADALGATLGTPRHAAAAAVAGGEYEFAASAPLRQDVWSAVTVAMPCASDLYQKPDFQETVRRLVASGFRVAVSESNYDHVPIRTWERFMRPEVKVYGRLGVPEQVELFRGCGFVLLPGDTLRAPADVVNLAVLALTSGALPVVVGRSLPPPLDTIIHCAWNQRELHAYLARNSSFLVREREWLARFRRFMDLRRTGRFRHALLDAAARVPLARNPLSQPSAEFVCVSKRPDKLPQIVDNFRRQAYGNLGLHLVWNVAAHEAQACLERSAGMRVPNMRVTVLDEAYNIGSCLNHGIRHSQADYWFKVDDDDYYGRHYAADLVNFYELTGCDASGKPSGFLYFEHEKELYLRDHAPAQARRPLAEGAYFCGATLSGRRAARLPLFSTEYRNSCDSKWVEAVQAHGHSVHLSDLFNFCINRGDVQGHTWQIAKRKIEKNSQLLARAPCREWLHAE